MKTKHTNPSQSLRILKHLKNGKKLTPMQALTYFGCFRLAARVKELRFYGLSHRNHHNLQPQIRQEVCHLLHLNHEPST
jgi:hypothetical protein